ncbi:response regulator transcription factor [Nocardia sp. BMG111209]|uniref:response regulator transcription factor n=1 Tax=Nocardia sp. BMG111209 TaxID=1160137 RepID=UPI00036B9F82|nr:helix-turn-helix transcriptional regulator [Nocardia sp. BMG111209]
MSTPTAAAVTAEQIRTLHTEMRSIAQSCTDPLVRSRLGELSTRLVRLISAPGAVDVMPALAPRELDVLAQVALGRTNAQTARQLSIQPETVKSYLRSAMTKLAAHTRYEAVVHARRLGLLP